MSSHESKRSRLSTSLLALGATIALGAALAAPAGAFSGQGEAVIAAADHSKGRTLSGQGVKLLAGAGAGSQSGKLTLPIAELNPTGAQPSAHSSAGLTFKKGKESVALTGIRFDLAAGTLVGKLGDAEIPVFWLGAAPKVNAGGGSISLSEGRLRLTAEAATALKDDLGLERALVRKGVGMLWIAAQAAPTHIAKPIASGSLEWGFLTSWREYVYKELGPGSVGSITTEGGATTTGNPAQAGSFFTFPASGGSFKEGLFGASDLLSLNTQGSVKFAKPGHCIVEIKFSNVVVTLGSSSSIVADLNYDIDKFNGMGCTDQPPVAAPNTTIATLGTVAPTYSAGGKTVTWTALPATLTAAAATPFSPQYKAGQVLDPVTVTVGLG